MNYTYKRKDGTKHFEVIKTNGAVMIFQIIDERNAEEVVSALNHVAKHEENSFLEQMEKFVNFSLKTFLDATESSSLIKLEEEIKELREVISDGGHRRNATEEYVDCIMCLVDSAARLSIHPEDLFEVFKKKLYINMMREWKSNGDGTYSHVKIGQ